MINNIDNNQIPEGALNTNKGVSGATQNVNSNVSQQASPQNSTDSTQDASLQISFDSIMEQAKQIPAENDSAVANAKALIASGQLDTPHHILKAAQNMLKYGV